MNSLIKSCFFYAIFSPKLQNFANKFAYVIYFSYLCARF